MNKKDKEKPAAAGATADAFKIAQNRHKRRQQRNNTNKKKKKNKQCSDDDDEEEDDENCDIYDNTVVDFSRPQHWMNRSSCAAKIKNTNDDNDAYDDNVSSPPSSPVIIPMHIPHSSFSSPNNSVSTTTNSTTNNHPQQKQKMYQGPMYALQNFPGFLYAPNALSPTFQLQLAHQALTFYCEHPHRTNIDLVDLDVRKEVPNEAHESMWHLWKEQFVEEEENCKEDDETEKKKISKKESQQTKKRKGQHKIIPLPNSPKNNNNHNKKKKKKKYKSFDKLSWSTMGYHYDWTSRSYNDEMKSDMPLGLVQLSQMFAAAAAASSSVSCITECNNNNNNKNPPPPENVMMQHNSKSTSQNNHYTPSAAIVNYYHTKSIMGGHRDDLEYDFSKPVISISLGLPAVFLLGGKHRHGPSHDEEKEEEEKDCCNDIVPILVRPGDVMILGGDCRLNYHGMARVVTPPSSSSSSSSSLSTTMMSSKKQNDDDDDDGVVVKEMGETKYIPRNNNNEDGDELWWLPKIDTSLKQTCQESWIRTCDDFVVDVITENEQEKRDKIMRETTTTTTTTVSNDTIPESDYHALLKYLSQHRININVRQVLPDGVSSISQFVSQQQQELQRSHSKNEG